MKQKVWGTKITADSVMPFAAAKDAVLRELYAEARKSQRAAERKFKRYDNHEDMHAAESWDMVCSWLEAKVVT